MPCQADPSLIAESDRLYGYKEGVRSLKPELDRLTRLLCEATNDWRAGKPWLAASDEMKEWRTKHDEQDRRRLAREEIQRANAANAERLKAIRAKARADALSKLTQEDRDALSL